MKFKLKKKLKIGILIFLIIGAMISSFFLYSELGITKTKEIDQPVYTYKSTSNIDYQVYLKPNIIYDNTIMESDKTYISQLVDYVNVTFDHTFKGDREAKLSGSYSITAQVRGYTGSDKEMKTIWIKDFPLVAEKTFSKSSGDLELKEQLKLDINTYSDLVKKIATDTKISTSNDIVLKMNINYTAETDKGLIKETFSPSLDIPLNIQLFEITKIGVEPKDGDIKVKVNKEIPVNNQTVTLCIALLVILIASILFTIFVVSEPTSEDIYINKINRIFKNHNNRLVGVDSNTLDGWDRFYKVHSIEDLVKICDEIEKPIMYKHSSNIKDMNEFFVIDNNKTIYKYEVQELVENIEQENDLGESIPQGQQFDQGE